MVDQCIAQLGMKENTRVNIHCDYHYSVEFVCGAESCSILFDCDLTMDVLSAICASYG